MLKGILLYYSNTGNTRLACEYLKSKLTRAELDLADIVRGGPVSLSPYDVAGFAFFTDTWRPPALFMRRAAALLDTQDKPAFSLNTYGCLTGRSSVTMCRALRRMGMNVIGAHSLHTPENYPPMVASGHGFAESPGDKELQSFNAFIHHLDFALGLIDSGKAAPSARPAPGFPNVLLPSRAGALMSLVFGKPAMRAEPAQCVRCGLCEKVCPAGAVTLQPAPVFDHSVCERCWSCYNHCPHKAVHTGRFTGQGQYPRPPQGYADKMSPVPGPR